MISDDINYLIEGILQARSPPSQKLLMTQNLTAALAPTAGLLYASSWHKDDATQLDGRGLTQFQQLRDYLNKHGGLSKENILTKLNNPNINKVLSIQDDAAKLQKLQATAKYGNQAAALNNGSLSSPDDINKAHELVTKAGSDPEKLLTTGHEAIAAHKNIIGQTVDATPAIPGHAIDLAKTSSLASNLNPAMLAAGAGGSLAALGAGYLLKKGVQKYQQVRYGIAPPKDNRTPSQKAFDVTHAVGRSLASKAVGAAATAATIGGIGLAVGSGIAPIAAAGGAIASGGLSTLLGAGVGIGASLKFSKANMALRQKIEVSRQKQLQIKQINDQVNQVNQNHQLTTIDKQEQLKALNAQKQNILQSK
jgi:hypothetical protein